MYPTQSMSLHRQDTPSSKVTFTASAGTNRGWVVMMLRPAPLWGSSSVSRSFSYSFSMFGSSNSSENRLIKVDFPVRTGPATAI